MRAPPWAPETLAPEENDRQRGRKRSAAQIERQSAAASDAEQQLGKLALQFALKLKTDGWRRLVDQTRGKSNISDKVEHLSHRAARLLGHLKRRGASVTLANGPWSVEDNDDAIRRGPHKSSHGERAFVAEEMLDFCQQGYWLVLPYSVVRHLPNLRISPLGVVPQRDRRPRLIVDYSHSDVNHNTLPLAPREAMQFGRALQRVLSTIVHVDPRYGPVHLAKIDVADGFYRVWLQVADIPKLGVALPVSPGGEQLFAFPLTLPMGWVQSPPYFTVVTETACDRANLMLTQRTDPRLRQAHRLETLAATPPEPMAAPLVTTPPRTTDYARTWQTTRRSGGRLRR